MQAKFKSTWDQLDDKTIDAVTSLIEMNINEKMEAHLTQIKK